MTKLKPIKIKDKEKEVIGWYYPAEDVEKFVNGINEVLEWIVDVRKECKKIIKLNLKKVMDRLKSGNINTIRFNVLLQEIRDSENEDALLSLIESMIRENLK